uniref:Nuclear transcription factor Y subunit n=1 Tax=Percolomonas cosmopolitus TaxID=63605 RepID=A0A7S1PJ01_9EUKA|eukprot:CAMPEP_0117443404 /NCGR_PEP_ID=MMETSP0759-20121206/4677_1 /TAXON_ID=63605 /ORGANISM="Percolomonas cosmopolitus, Strain WS" /LENGTH=467 /DNA_ID=CAMNT_0005235377 /DNA_START=168 /DNA_END=1571 /DNA_ORIENTATION=-
MPSTASDNSCSSSNNSICGTPASNTGLTTWQANPSTNPSHPHHYRLSLRTYALSQLHEIAKARYSDRISNARVRELIGELFEKCEEAFREHLRQLACCCESSHLHDDTCCFTQQHRINILQRHIALHESNQHVSSGDAVSAGSTAELAMLTPFREYLDEELQDEDGWDITAGRNDDNDGIMAPQSNNRDTNRGGRASANATSTHYKSQNATQRYARRPNRHFHDPDGPLYVNSKQYQRILKRREQRLRLHKRLAMSGGEQQGKNGADTSAVSAPIKIIGTLPVGAPVTFAAGTNSTTQPGATSGISASLPLFPSQVSTTNKRKQPDSPRLLNPRLLKRMPTPSHPQQSPHRILDCSSPTIVLGGANGAPPQPQGGLLLLGMVKTVGNGEIQIVPSPQFHHHHHQGKPFHLQNSTLINSMAAARLSPNTAAPSPQNLFLTTNSQAPHVVKHSLGVSQRGPAPSRGRHQ